MKSSIVYIILACLLLPLIIIARPDGHAPISVMADHTHPKGESMISYRFMNMSMSEIYSGSSSLSQQQIYNNLPMFLNLFLI